MVKMIVEITQMRLVVRKKITLAQLVSLLATTDNASTIISYVTKWPIAQMNLMSLYIAMSTNVPKLKFTSVDINA